MQKPSKEDFEVFDKSLGNDGGAYKPLGQGRWYNDYMYQEVLKASELHLHSCSACGKSFKSQKHYTEHHFNGDCNPNDNL